MRMTKIWSSTINTQYNFKFLRVSTRCNTTSTRPARSKLIMGPNRTWSSNTTGHLWRERYFSVGRDFQLFQINRFTQKLPVLWCCIAQIPPFLFSHPRIPVIPSVGFLVFCLPVYFVTFDSVASNPILTFKMTLIEATSSPWYKYLLHLQIQTVEYPTLLTQRQRYRQDAATLRRSINSCDTPISKRI